MKTAAAILAVVLTTGCAHVVKTFDGQPGGIANGKTAGFFLQEENDLFTPKHFGDNPDNYYTQGLRWGKTIIPQANPEFINGFARWFCKRLCTGLVFDRPLWTSGIAQTMFTPDDLTVNGPQPYDRPWAGFIYLDNTFRMTDPAKVPQRQVSLELQTGHIGKRSGAEWAQSALHTLLPKAPHPTWYGQLERGVALEGIYASTWRWGNEYVDVQPHAGGAFGNTQIYVNGGAQVRIGWNLAGFFNSGPMQGTFDLPVGEAVHDVPRNVLERPHWEGFVYAGGNVAWIPYNYFLSKGEFHRERNVADFQWGGSLRYRSYRLTVNFVRRSRELRHRLAPPFGTHEYGSIVLAYELVIPSNPSRETTP